MFTLSGTAVSDGTAAAKAVILTPAAEYGNLPEPRSKDSQSETDLFIKRCSDYTSRLRSIAAGSPDNIRELYGAAAGFISSEQNINQVCHLIERGTSAPMACRSVYISNLNTFKQDSGSSADEFADRKEIYHLLLEFIATLLNVGHAALNLPVLTEPCVIVARDLSPAQFLSLDRAKVKALILEGGNPSGHLVTVLRELGIPAIFGVAGATTIRTSEPVVIDANNGVIVIEPPDETVRNLPKTQITDYEDKGSVNPLPGITMASAMGVPAPDFDYHNSVRYGIGLLRSEFGFLNYDHEPTEDEMTRAFERIFSQVPPNMPITARTFDFADDKKPFFALNPDDSGPLNGYGACVGTRLLRKQLNAILRAAPGRRVTIVFPLVTRISESRYLHALAEECSHHLSRKGIPPAAYDIALMIETPAAVLAARAFAEHCSMFIVGTSSLAEYAAAPRPASSTFTPALAKMLFMAAFAAHAAGVPIGVAGRYAPRLDLMPFFLGMGVTHFAVNSYRLPRMRAAVESMGLPTPAFNQALFDKVMNLYTGRELAALITDLGF